MRRPLRAVARRIGIDLRFPDVICVTGIRSVELDEDCSACITTKRTLVFLQQPAAGDLCDTYRLGADVSVSSVVYVSPDAIELSRVQTDPQTLTVFWLPRERVNLYTLYQHETAWRPLAAFSGPIFCLEYQCDMRTGAFTIEVVAPISFEAAVVFARPRWPRRLTERRIVRAALAHLRVPGVRPRILDAGRRIECSIQVPSVGERYLFVAFRNLGIATCEQWLRETSVVSRFRRALATWPQGLVD